MKAIDVLGFAGGFTLGMVQAGFELVGKKEMKGGFGVANCEANRHLLGHNWRAQAGDPAGWTTHDAEVVFGNPPCSGFSVMSSKEFRGADSKINHCMWAFAEYVARVRPVVAVFESVPQAFRSTDGHVLMQRLRQLVEDQSGLRYTLSHVLHNAYSVGGCAQRPRYFWVISQVPFGIERPVMNEYPLFRDVLMDLRMMPQTWSAQPYNGLLRSKWIEDRVSPTGQVDGHMAVSNPLTSRIRDLIDGVEWGSGEHVSQVARRYYDTHGELPLSWHGTQQKLIDNDFFMGFTTPVRWRSDQPARVITGGGPVMVVHPWLPRTLTHREIARILGFPDDWLIEPLKSVPGLNMTWGKGITVDCGRWIGEWIKRAIEGEPGTHTGQLIGDREWMIDVTHDWKLHASWYSKTVAVKPRVLVHAQRRSTMTEPGTDTPTEPRVSRTEKLSTRDEQVFELLGAGAKTRNEVGETSGLTVAETYLALNRLRTAGRVQSERRDGRNVWFRPDVAEPAAAE
jgi:site-specific DNA-cytosine methylase